MLSCFYCQPRYQLLLEAFLDSPHSIWPDIILTSWGSPSTVCITPHLLYLCFLGPGFLHVLPALRNDFVSYSFISDPQFPKCRLNYKNQFQLMYFMSSNHFLTLPGLTQLSGI